MIADIFHERGMHMVEYDYGDENECRFPLFNFLKPLPLPWMYMVFLTLLSSELFSDNQIFCS